MKLQHLYVAITTLAQLAVTAAAQAQLATDHQIPYQGQLDLDGVPMNGQFNFWFELYATPTGGDCQITTPPAVDCLWADEVTGVAVVGGHFSVVLGSAANPLGDAVWQNAEVYLGIRVAAAGDGYTALAGRQRILAVPMAARAETAKNYHVTGALVVDGSATLNSGATVDGPLVTRGILPGYQDCAASSTGAGGAIICNDSGTFRHLLIAGNDTGGQSVRRVGIWDDLVVGRDLDVRGRHLPDYDSGWFPVNSSAQHEIQKTHGLGAVPSQVMLQQCGALVGNTCTTRVVLAGASGYQDGSAFVNPFRITATTADFFIGIHDAFAWGYYVPGTGWSCPNDADGNCETGYYRLLAWR